MSELGPCVVCGDTNYNLSCGGPTICPKCDCGNFDAATVHKQATIIVSLLARIAELEQRIEDDGYDFKDMMDRNSE
jgi:hypothetical protein